MRRVVTCVYGGAELKDGGTWDQMTSDEVVERVARRLDDFLESGGPEKVGEALAAAFELRRAKGALDD